MPFTKREGSDDTRDVVAQRAVDLSYMTQTRGVAGGVLTTDKVSDGAGGSLTRVALEPEPLTDLPETRYIFSTVISADKTHNASRIAWLLKKDNTDISSLNSQRMEVVRLLPFTRAKRPTQRVLSFVEISNTFGSRGDYSALRFLVAGGVISGIGEIVYQRDVEGTPTSLLTQFMLMAPRGAANTTYVLSVIFQPATTGFRETNAIDGSATSIAAGYRRRDTAIFGIPYLHYAVPTPAPTTGIHVGVQELRYLRLSAHAEANVQPKTLGDHLIFRARRGRYYGDPIVTRITKEKLIALAVNVTNQTIVGAGGVGGGEYVSEILVDEPVVFTSNDDGVTWMQGIAPAFDMANYGSAANSNFVDFIYSFDSKARNPLLIQELTKLVPWSKTHAFGASLFYSNGTSSSGGEYRAFLIDGTNAPQELTIPIAAYRYALVHACRPVGAAVLTFRARADASYPFYQDGIYPAVPHFSDLSASGYADRTLMVIYDGNSIVTRELPWTRLYANGPVFSITNKEIGTVVYNTSPSTGTAGYWVFSSVDYGETWKEKFLVDQLSDPPSFSDDGEPAEVTQREVVYTNTHEFSLPPRIVFPELIDGLPIPTHPGAPWINT